MRSTLSSITLHFLHLGLEITLLFVSAKVSGKVCVGVVVPEGQIAYLTYYSRIV